MLLALCACQDHWDDFTPVHEPAPSSQAELYFQAAVAPAQTAVQTLTRADGSIVNRLETSLFETKPRTYYDATGTPETRQYSVGLFAAYTGNSNWSNTATANYMFNQKMDIAAPDADGRNQLYYASTVDGAAIGTRQDSLRYWPNKDASGSYGKLSFWAYYPWSETRTGDHGIAITPAATTVGTQSYGIDSGMGSVLFTMAEDASEQSDFMMSELVSDCSRVNYPLNGTIPTPVQLRFHHLLAQVRLYAFIRCTDKIVYKKDDSGHTLVVESFDTDNKKVTLWPKDESLHNGDNKTPYTTTDDSFKAYVDAWGVTHTYGDTSHPFDVGDSIPDDTPWLSNGSAKSIRWKRGTTLDVTGKRYRSTAAYEMSFNNIHTECIFTPSYDAATGKTTISYTDVGTLGSATVSNYIMNPYWFRFKDGERVMLNETYMYDYFETTPAANRQRSVDNIDGIDWSEYSTANPLNYISDSRSQAETLDPDYTRGSTLPRYEGINSYESLHFNYAPGNILLCVPQVMNDNDVPHVVLEGTGTQVKYTWDGSKYVEDSSAEGNGTAISGKVTINLLNMRLKWESGFIYSYAFIDDDLKPGDDKVLGPESITVVFDPTKHTDQW